MQMGSRLSKIAIAGVTLAALAAAAATAGTTEKRPESIDHLLACRSVTDSAQRLACFDKESAGLAGAIDRREVVAVDKEQIQTARRSLFGFTIPKNPILGFGGKDDDGPRELTSTIKSAHQTRDGRWVITLPDGAVWIQLDDTVPFHPPHAGSTVVIRPALAGTYFIRVDGQIGFRAKRDS